MYKKIKVLVLVSFLAVSCSKIPIISGQEFVPIDTQHESFDLDKPQFTQEPKAEEIEIETVENIEEEEIKEDNQKCDVVVGNLLKNSNMSYYAVDLDTGKVLVDHRGENVATPASVMKIVSSAAAFEILGKDTTLKTKLLYDGTIDKNGVLKGNIYIQGAGDPTLGSEFFKGDREAFIKQWIASIKKAGIKTIKGNVIVIDDLFGYNGVSSKWLLEDLASGYGQGAYGVSIFDNLSTLYITSDANKGKVTKSIPELKNVSFVNSMKISPKGRTDVSVRGLPFNNTRELIGEIPANRKNIIVKSDIPDPGLFLGEYFKNKVSADGIKITGNVKTSRTTKVRPKNPKELAVTESKTISEIINVILVKSNNHYAEHMFNLLQVNGINLNKFWKEKGIDTSSLGVYDGSGLSRADYISSKVLTEILIYMYKNQPEYIKLLPRAGYEGTVVNFLTVQNFDGEARLKSGSMSGVQSYAGYLDKDGKNIAFAMIINQWNGTRRQVKKEMERLLKQLF